MTETAEDFWPENIGTAELEPPVTIMRQQAALLGPKTQNLVEAQVETTPSGDQLVHRFYIVAPTLGGYRYRLFEAMHPATSYPVRVQIRNHAQDLRDPREFRRFLQETLSSEETRNLVASLLAQTRQ